MFEKFKSRKLWFAIITAVLVVLNTELGWGIPADVIDKVIFLVATWIGVEGAADVVSRFVSAKK